VLLWQVACEFVAVIAKAEIAGFHYGPCMEPLADYLTIFPLILPASGTLARGRTFHAEDGWSFWDAMIVAAVWSAALRASTQRTCQAAQFAVRLRS
jgi:hypothetical protein